VGKGNPFLILFEEGGERKRSVRYLRRISLKKGRGVIYSPTIEGKKKNETTEAPLIIHFYQKRGGKALLPKGGGEKSELKGEFFIFSKPFRGGSSTPAILGRKKGARPHDEAIPAFAREKRKNSYIYREGGKRGGGDSFPTNLGERKNLLISGRRRTTVITLPKAT